MAFFKREPKTNSFGTRTIFSNTFDAPFDANKLYNYYGIIEINGKDWRFNYTGKLRSEAETYFEEQARLEQGKYKFMSIYK